MRFSTGKDDFTEGYGTFAIIDNDLDQSSSWTIDYISDDSNSNIVLRGILMSELSTLSYSLTFYIISDCQMGIKISLEASPDYKIFLTLASTKDEGFYGTGEQLTHFNLKGQAIPIMVREDGVGRGLQPLTFFTNRLFGPYAGR